jgi:hypothetical protein
LYSLQEVSSTAVAELNKLNIQLNLAQKEEQRLLKLLQNNNKNI